MLVSRAVYLKVYLSTIGLFKVTVKMDVLNTGLFSLFSRKELKGQNNTFLHDSLKFKQKTKKVELLDIFI